MTDVSVIVSTRNRACALANALKSIANVVRPSETVEIIVIDNGSSDRTGEVCKHIRERFPRHHWRFFYDDMPGLLTGRHRGAKEAGGDILAYLDDDILLTPTWLESLMEGFSDPSVVLLGGPSTPVFERDPPLWLRDFWTETDGGCLCGWLSLIDCGNAIKPTDPLLIWGLNFAVRRNTFKHYGGFHPDCVPKPLQRYQGDGETGLAIKIKTAGLSCLYHPGFALKHVLPASRLTPFSLEERAFYQGICDSFTQIRRDRQVPIEPRYLWRDILRPMKSNLERSAVLRRPCTEGVRRLAARAHLAGMRFHQSEVRNDPRLLDWVLRQNYFDYRLPDGWKHYLQRGRTLIGRKYEKLLPTGIEWLPERANGAA